MEVAFTCTACRVSLDSDEQRRTHYKTNWHRYNVKRRCNQLPPVDEDTFDRKVAAVFAGDEGMLRRGSPSPPASSAGKKKLRAPVKQSSSSILLRCRLCGNSYRSQAAMEQHLGSLKHTKKAEVAELQARKLKDPSYTADVVQVLEEKTREPGDGNVESKVALVEEDEEKAISVGQCLFCKESEFSSIESCLEHMKLHGFLLPFVEHLVDLEGLISYLGAKVGVGNMCVFCESRHSSIASSRLHMFDKGHCKMRWDEADPEFEYDEFYEFPEECSREGVHPVGLAATGEMLLSDGTRLGHRELQTYYRQRLRPFTERDSIRVRLLTAAGGGEVDVAASSERVSRKMVRAKAANDLRICVQTNRLVRNAVAK